MGAFTGFTPATFEFLEDLGANNEKVWFDAHRDRYEQHYLEPAKAFVEAIASPLAGLAPDIVAEPRVNGSIFRINRDIRFSKDKTPYKDHLDLWFWEGERKGAVSGFYLRLTDEAVHLGAGSHGFDKERLATFRSKVADDRSRAGLVTAIGEAEQSGASLWGETYKRVPKDYPSDDPDAQRLLKHSALSAGRDHALPDAIGGEEFVDWCLDQWRPLAALHRWLMEEVG